MSLSPMHRRAGQELHPQDLVTLAVALGVPVDASIAFTWELHLPTRDHMLHPWWRQTWNQVCAALDWPPAQPGDVLKSEDWNRAVDAVLAREQVRDADQA